MRAFFLASSLAFLVAACGSNVPANSTTATSASSSSGAATSSSTSSGMGGAGGSGGAAAGGAGGAGGKIDKAANCTGTFGSALTSSFGRIDGTVLAVVKPSDTQCPMPNNDHVILEVTMGGAVYRMVVNVQSSFGNPDVFFLKAPHTMPAPAWSDGWHTGLKLDFVKDFGVHAGDFKPIALAPLSDTIADAITIGQKISVYAESSGGASAHKIHRNDGLTDGAIVLDPDAKSPTVMLFHFGEQMF
jgi:hypothetical protein